MLASHYIIILLIWSLVLDKQNKLQVKLNP